MDGRTTSSENLSQGNLEIRKLGREGFYEHYGNSQFFKLRFEEKTGWVRLARTIKKNYAKGMAMLSRILYGSPAESKWCAEGDSIVFCSLSLDSRALTKKWMRRVKKKFKKK